MSLKILEKANEWIESKTESKKKEKFTGDIKLFFAGRMFEESRRSDR